MSAVSVYATFADAEEAARIGETLIAERLAACINILPPIRSIYRWRGEIMRGDEAAAILKTSQAGAAALIARIVELHSYDMPCVVAWPIADLPPPLSAWIEDCVG